MELYRGLNRPQVRRQWRGRGAALIVTALLSTAVMGTVEAASEPAAKAAPVAATGQTQLLTGDQGIQLNTVYFPGKTRGQGVVLLHMDGRSGDDWRPLAEKLSRAGFHTLVMDLRGHGKSTRFSSGKTLSYEQLDPAQYQAMVKDVGTAVSFLRGRPGVDPARISIVGASVGANLALRYGAEDAKISNLILLSPGLDYKGLTTEDAMRKYGTRPVFIAVSREDTFSAKSSLLLDSESRGQKYFQTYTGAGHGTRMLSREPGLEMLMTGWLNGTLVSPTTDDEESAALPPVSPSRRRP